MGRVTRRFLAGVAAGASLGLAPTGAWGGLEGEQVISGQATVTRSGSHTEIETATQRTIMEWTSFDIGTTESVHIAQPTTHSRTLNRVRNAQITRIDGSLTSNGQVWVVNPAGVYFGGSAIVETAGIIAAAGQVSNEGFLNGERRFEGLVGAVVNEGVLRAGEVTLAGRRVANHGTIVAREGSLTLAAGDEVWITEHGSFVQVRVDGLSQSPASSGVPALENTGDLIAEGGRVQLAAGDFLGVAIHAAGLVRAAEITVDAGEGLAHVEGVLDASGDEPGERGGRIEVLGNSVVLDGAELDASGTSGGGTVLVGGGVGGGGDTPTSRYAYTSGDSVIRADATSEGDGGTVVVWADEAAGVHGTITARGGEASGGSGGSGGDGGFVETSTHGRIDLSAQVSVAAPQGQAGEWLIDPVNVEVVDQVTGDELVEFTNQGNTTFFPLTDPPGGELVSQVAADSIKGALGDGALVAVTTATILASLGSQQGNLVVNAPIEIDASARFGPQARARLVLRAANDLILNEPIRVGTDADGNSALALDLTLRANDNIQTAAVFGEFGQADPETSVGDLVLGTASDGGPIVQTGGGSLDASGVNIDLLGDVETAGGSAVLTALNFFEAQNPDDGRVTILGDVTTDGGFFQSGGDGEFVLEGRIDVLRADAPQIPLGLTDPDLRVVHDADVTINGDLAATVVDLEAGLDGTGTLFLSPDGGGHVIAGRRIVLAAGDPTQGEGQGASIVADPSARFQSSEMGTDLPEILTWVQDAAVSSNDLPALAQFGPAGAPPSDLSGMQYTIDSQESSVTIEAGQQDRVDGSDLVLAAHDQIVLLETISPERVELRLREAFTVTEQLAQRLNPVIALRLHGAAAGEGDLDFDPLVVLEADEIELFAGSQQVFIPPTQPEDASGLSRVLARSANDGSPGPEFRSSDGTAAPTLFALRQDAAVGDDVFTGNVVENQLPTPSQFPGGSVAGIDYRVRADQGDVTIIDPADVLGTDLSLVSSRDIVLEAAIDVDSIDVGGLFNFEVTQALLDNIRFTVGLGKDRVTTLRAGLSFGGLLSFEGGEMVDDSGQTIVVPSVVVEGDEINLIAGSGPGDLSFIDLSGDPEFVKERTPTGGGPLEAPDRFVFQQTADINDSNAPTSDLFPNGDSPSELLALRSLGSISFHRTDVGGGLDDLPIPAAPGRLLLSAPSVRISSATLDDLVLPGNLEVRGNSIGFDATRAVLDFDPIVEPVVNASALVDPTASLRAFDPEFDLQTTPDDAPIVMTISQSGQFGLDSSGQSRLPDPAVFGPDRSEMQYVLGSALEGIEVENDRVSRTRLTLEVVNGGNPVVPDSGKTIVFEPTDPTDPTDPGLVVTSLVAAAPGEFVVGAQPAGGTPPIEITAEEFIDLQAAQILSFAPFVTLQAENVTLRGGLVGASGTTQTVDALTNLPRFRIVDSMNTESRGPTFSFRQNAPLVIAPIDGTTPVASVPIPLQFLEGLDALDLYEIGVANDGIEINDLSPFVGPGGARPQQLTFAAPQVTLRAASTVPDLVLGKAVVSATNVLLEAPRGSVDASQLELHGTNTLTLRQRDQLTFANGTMAPDSREIFDGAEVLVYRLEALGGIEVGADLAERLASTNLLLAPGYERDDLAAAIDTGTTGAMPGDDTYDLYLDFDSNGVIDNADRVGLDLALGRLQIGDDPADPSTTVLDLEEFVVRANPDPSKGIGVGRAEVRTRSSQTYDDDIFLTSGTSTFVARGALLNTATTETPASIFFNGRIDGTTPWTESIVASATEDIVFAEPIGTSVALASLQVDLLQLLQIDSPPPVPAATFGSAALPGTFTVRAHEILLNPQDDPDNTLVRSGVPDLPTFSRPGGSLRLETDASGRVIMGPNEKLAVGGSLLEITGRDPSGALVPLRSATIGDLSATDQITVMADAIHIRKRGRGQVTRANGVSFSDSGVDFVAKNIDFRFPTATGLDASQTLLTNQIGSGRNAVFVVENPFSVPGFMKRFTVFSIDFNVLESPTGRVVDGVVDGISRADLTRAFDGPVPSPPIAVPAAFRVADPVRLAKVGIAARPESESELRSRLRGAAIYDDSGTLAGRALPIAVSEHRLNAMEADRAADIYGRIFGGEARRAGEIRESLQSALDDYRSSTGARRIFGFELRRYIYNRPSSQYHAYQALQELDSLFRHHRRAGLSPAEYRTIQEVWMQRVVPEGITLQEFAELIHPSRYIRGSDVLDVFGD